MRVAAISLVALVLVGCGGRSDTYTLYRNSPIDEHMRIHLATFDASEPGNYNADNCEIARELFQAQNGVSARYWCEKGSFRP